jgi:uncharacterized membrane protein YhaH (DUF805 family)
MWPVNVLNLSTPALNAKYAFLLEINRKRAMSVALIFTVVIASSLAIIIALCMAVLRLHDNFTERGAE